MAYDTNMSSSFIGLRLGLDVDGTITLDPKLFAEITVQCKQSGGEVHIVTSRAELSRQETVRELRDYGIQFESIHFLGDMSRANETCPHKELDWFQRYLWGKVAYAQQHQLDYFVDDDKKVLSLFATYAPEIVVTPAESRVQMTDPLYEQAVHVVLAYQQASVALVQRRLRLGYSRVVRLMEAMAEAGIVSQQLGPDGLREIQERYQRMPTKTDTSVELSISSETDHGIQ